MEWFGLVLGAISAFAGLWLANSERPQEVLRVIAEPLQRDPVKPGGTHLYRMVVVGEKKRATIAFNAVNGFELGVASDAGRNPIGMEEGKFIVPMNTFLEVVIEASKNNWPEGPPGKEFDHEISFEVEVAGKYILSSLPITVKI